MAKDHKIRAVGFDLFGTMIAFSIEDQLDYLVDRLGVSSGDLGAAVLSKLKYSPEGGPVSNIWSRVSREVGVEIPSSLVEGWQNSFFEILVRPEMVALVKSLQRNGYAVGLLSNIEVGTILPKGFQEVFRLFNVALRSDEIGHSKPEPQAFQALINGFQLKSQEIVFIDDLPGNIRGAEAAGLRGIQFHNIRQLIDELTKLGVDAN